MFTRIFISNCHKVGQKPKQLAFMNHNLLTDAGTGLDACASLHEYLAGTRGAGYIASTESSITPAAANTTLTGEISARTDWHEQMPQQRPIAQELTAQQSSIHSQHQEHSHRY